MREPVPRASPDEAHPTSLPNQDAGEPQAWPAAGQPADGRQERGRRNVQIRLGEQAGQAPPAGSGAVLLTALVQQLHAYRGFQRGFQATVGVVPIKPDLGGAETAEPEAGAYLEPPWVFQGRKQLQEALAEVPDGVREPPRRAASGTEMLRSEVGEPGVPPNTCVATAGTLSSSTTPPRSARGSSSKPGRSVTACCSCVPSPTR